MGIVATIRRELHRQKYRRTIRNNPHIPAKMVFIHTVKTGGTSINSYFKEYMGSGPGGGMVRFDDFAQTQDKASLIARGRQARYVAGHISWNTFQQVCNEDTFSFTIMREPYDRLRSLYHYFRSIPADFRGAPLVADVRNMSLAEFLTSNHEWVRFHADNFVARQFSGSLDVFPANSAERADFAARAITNLSGVSYMGFHDDYERAFADIVRVAGLPVPAASPQINVTAEHLGTATERAAARAAFDTETRELAYPLVEADLIIYNHFDRLRREAG
jgi:hypothetical protein